METKSCRKLSINRYATQNY